MYIKFIRYLFLFILLIGCSTSPRIDEENRAVERVFSEIYSESLRTSKANKLSLVKTENQIHFIFEYLKKPKNSLFLFLAYPTIKSISTKSADLDIKKDSIKLVFATTKDTTKIGYKISDLSSLECIISVGEVFINNAAKNDKEALMKLFNKNIGEEHLQKLFKILEREKIYKRTIFNDIGCFFTKRQAYIYIEAIRENKEHLIFEITLDRKELSIQDIGINDFTKIR